MGLFFEIPKRIIQGTAWKKDDVFSPASGGGENKKIFQRMIRVTARKKGDVLSPAGGGGENKKIFSAYNPGHSVGEYG